MGKGGEGRGGAATKEEGFAGGMSPEEQVGPLSFGGVG